MKHAHRRTVIGVVGSALAAIAIALGMLGVGNVPSYSAPPGCAAGQACTPSSVTTGTVTATVVDAGTLIAASGGNLCLDGPTCSVSIMNNAGQMVFSAPVAGGRFPALTAQGTTTLGSAFADYLTIVGGSSGSGTTITAVSPSSNSGFTFVPKGTTGTFAVSGKLVTTSATIGSTGATISSFRDFSSALDVASILPGTCQENTITATGVTRGDAIIPAWPDEMQNNSTTIGLMFVDADSSITVRLCNIGVVAQNPSSATYGGFWLHHQ